MNLKFCPVLALARFLFFAPQTFAGKNSLFDRNSHYNRYSKIFAVVIEDNKQDLADLGVAAGDLGTPSARKGVETLVAAGCTVSPPIVSLCLRMGWSMGGSEGKKFKIGRGWGSSCWKTSQS
mmetsp:Transcript_28156/g.34783  ORF Transcript_28156/g.34783 Transcript_28156/m.34783 type:complete len:122 (-) Transcript_28156:597-962(-)